jgi:peptide/nickel transport system substrate-binding protein
VRHALHLALDREEIVQRVYKGMAAVASQPVAPPVFGFNTRLPAPRPDLSAAARLLAEAGYARGFRTRLVISTARLELARLIAKQWRRVGVELGIDGVPSADVGLVAAGGVPLYLLGWDCSTGEASEAYEFLLHTPDARYGRGNYGRYSNTVLDSIAEVNSAILDPLKRRRLLEEAASLVMHDLPILPLFVSEDIYGVREGIRYRPRTDNQVRLAAVSFE